MIITTINSFKLNDKNLYHISWGINCKGDIPTLYIAHLNWNRQRQCMHLQLLSSKGTVKAACLYKIICPYFYWVKPRNWIIKCQNNQVGILRNENFFTYADHSQSSNFIKVRSLWVISMGKISAQRKFIPEDSNLIVLTFWVDCYHISSAMKWIFYFQKKKNNLKKSRSVL